MLNTQVGKAKQGKAKQGKARQGKIDIEKFKTSRSSSNHNKTAIA
jgi:hypothetical protein